MSKTLAYASVVWIVGAAAVWTAGCSSKNDAVGGNATDASSASDSSQVTTGGDSSVSSGDAGDASAPLQYTLIDDMETTTHGPIELDAGFTAGETPAYWFNFGASKLPEAGPPPDTADPTIMMFTFSAVTPPHTTLPGITSSHAAHQACDLNVLYDVCGIGVEFAQVPDTDGGDAGSAVVDAGAVLDAGADGDAGPSIPETTVPFNISQYKGITFWGRTAVTTDAGGFDVKVLFPDTDTDPRGGVCNSANAGASGPTDTSECYNSYAEHVSFTGDWQQFTVMFSDLAIDGSFGFQAPAPWSGTNVYGINWQAQDNAMPDASAQPMDVWIDDVYFIQ
jgi:hypothetical protein